MKITVDTETITGFELNNLINQIKQDIGPYNKKLPQFIFISAVELEDGKFGGSFIGCATDFCYFIIASTIVQEKNFLPLIDAAKATAKLMKKSD